MDPMTWMMIASLASSGIGALGNYFGGGEDGPPVKSFEGGPLDPQNMLLKSNASIAGMGNALAKRAGQGVNLRGVTVQTPKGFSGGMLPQSIGLSGKDPSIADPS